MSTHSDENSNDSFTSIVSSTTFGRDLMERLAEIDANPRSPEPELPVVDLESEPPIIPKFDYAAVKPEPSDDGKIDVNQSVNQSVNLSVNQSISQSVDQSEDDYDNSLYGTPKSTSAKSSRRSSKSSDDVKITINQKALELKQVRWGDWGETPKKFPSDVKVVNKNFWERNQREKFNRMAIPNPLPHTTEFGLRTTERVHIDRSVDTSPYPPPDVNQGRFNCKFPAPAPPPESSYPTHMQFEFLEKAKESVIKDIEQAEQEKSWFELFMKEKIQFNVLDTDLKNVKFNTLRKGLPASHVISPDLVRLKDLVTCTLCEQISINPKCCAKCSKVYCFGCIRWLQSLPQDLELADKIDSLKIFMCINQTCLVGVEKNGYPEYSEIDNPEVKKFFEDAVYKCHRKFCTSQLIYCNLLYHLQTCRLGPVDFQFDKTLQLHNFVAGPVREELNQKPKRLTSLLPAHLKKQNPPLTHEQDWAQRAMIWGFLIKSYKQGEITPLQMRCQGGFANNYWNNLERQRDPTAPMSEAEAWTIKLGFPSVSNVPIPDVPQRWPTTQCSRIPHYLLAESSNWRRWSMYADIDDASSISSTSSMMLYALDIEDPQSPFIRINPFERLPPAEAEEVRDYLTENFPSCFNYSGDYRAPKPSQKLETMLAVERKRNKLAKAFANRPAVNLPPLLEEHVNVINELSATCDDKHLTFAINMFCCGIKEYRRVRPRPVWIIIVDGNMEVVYETFVRYREVEFIDQRFHGLSTADLKYARNLNTVRDQVTKFLACAKRVIGYGLINHLINLGLTRHEIRLLNYKFRDMNNCYSPYIESPMNLHVISFLWFCGYVLPATPHSPAVEAITAMRLYLLQWSEIEKLAERSNGIHNENAASTCGNRITSALLYDFCEGLKRKACRWPEEWIHNPRRIKIPEFNDNCVLPSNQIMKKPGEMSRPDLRKALRGKTILSKSNQASGKRSASSSSSSSPLKTLKPLEPSCSKVSEPELDSEDPIPSSSK